MANEDVSRKLGHVERELSVHGTALATTAEQMKNLSQRSDERLDYIRERFDGLQEAGQEISRVLDARHEDMLRARNRMVAAGTSILISCFTAAWFAVIVPIMEDVAVLERRLLDAEKRIAVHYHDPESD
jgi:predicted PurR-regulated permease PerM